MSFKPYPTGCVIHAFIDAALQFRREHDFDWRDIARVELPIADYLVPIVCEPLSEKKRSTEVFNVRISLHMVIAETLRSGRFDHTSITPTDLTDPNLLGLTVRIDYSIDPDPIARRHFRGWVKIMLNDGRLVECRLDPWLRMHVGEADTPTEVEAKFLANVGAVAGPPAAATLLEEARHLRSSGTISGFLAATERWMAAAHV